MKWIKASERLPEKTAKYFVIVKDNQRNFVWYEDKQFFVWTSERKMIVMPSYWLDEPQPSTPQRAEEVLFTVSCNLDCPDVEYGNCCNPSACIKKYTPYRNQPKEDDRIDKAIEWCDGMIEDYRMSLKNDENNKSENCVRIDSFIAAKNYLLTLKQQP